MTNTEKVLLDALNFASDFIAGNMEGVAVPSVITDAIRVADAAGNKEKDAFTLHALGFGLDPSDFGKVFTFRKRSYQITGIRPRSFKFPILGSRVPDGKTFKFPVDVVKRSKGVGV